MDVGMYISMYLFTYLFIFVDNLLLILISGQFT